MIENTEQNTNEERELPEMVPGSSGMYMISAKDGMEMGPMVLQAFMAKLREAADKADLEVKVEPMQGVLMIWWFPAAEVGTDDTFMYDLGRHMNVVPEGEMNVALGMIGMTSEELIDGLKIISVAKSKHITVSDVEGEPRVLISWKPWARAMLSEFDAALDRTNENVSEFYSVVEGAFDLDSNTPILEHVIYWEKLETWVDEMFHTHGDGFLVVPRTNLLPYDEGYDQLKELFEKACSKLALKGKMELHGPTDYIRFEWQPLTPEDIEEERTYLDAVFEDIIKEPRGTTRANKARMMQSADVETMGELAPFFETFGQMHELEIRLAYSILNAEAVIDWRPLSEKEQSWPVEECK